jgi:hypothetical protein
MCGFREFGQITQNIEATPKIYLVEVHAHNIPSSFD